MYYKLPIKERMELMKSYRKANPNMSYHDMVKDYNDSYEKFQDGGKKKSFNDWYKTVPSNKADTSSYNLRRAYELAPQKDLDNFVKDPNAHLYSTYKNKETGIYEFMKSKNHPTIQKELEWFNSNDPEAIKFRKNYKLDTSKDYYQYVPQQNKYGGIQKFGDGGKKKESSKTVVYTDKALFDKAYKAEMDTLHKYKEFQKYIKDGYVPVAKSESEAAKDFREYLKTDKKTNIKNYWYHPAGMSPKGVYWQNDGVVYLGEQPKKPVIHNIYQPFVEPPQDTIKPVIKDTVKQKPIVDNVDSGLTRRWNFNASNPTLEYYDKSNKLVRSEYYKNMNDFKQGKQIKQ